MAHVATTEEKEIVRREQQGSLLMLAALHPKIVFRARLNGVPSSTDMVAEIDYDGPSGTLADVKVDMTMYVGSTLDDWDMGTVRIRKAPTSNKFYIGEQSKIDWVNDCYLTVVQEFELRPKHLHISGTTAYIDYDVPFSDQHTSFKPVPVLGSHPVAELIDDTVDVQFGPEPGTASWVFGSTISAYKWTIPDAIAIDDDTAVRPIATFDSTGTHVAYCEVTADNGKKKVGARYAYIYDQDNPPTEIFDLSGYDEDSDNGGIIFSVDCKYGINLQDIRPGTLCILFSKDYYNNEEISLGSIAGQKNIKGIGVISNKEGINYDYQIGSVKFTVEGYQELFKRIYGFPFGLQMKNTPAGWTDMPALTVDRALHELLEWYCTATTIMDVILTGDTRYAKELSAPVSSLWQQMEKLAFATILANVHIDCLGRFFAEIDPLMIPVEDRDYPVIMEIEKQDWKDSIDFDYVTDSEISQVNLSGVAISLGGTAQAFFSLSPGHVFDRTGMPEIVDRLLLDTQTKANQLAGLIFSERNNKYPKLTIPLSGNNPLITCFPNQAVQFTLLSGDTPRGIAFNKNFIPRHRSLKYDVTKLRLKTTLVLEAETEETIAVNGDVPGSADFTFPPSFPQFPPFPDSPILLPGTPGTGDDAPPKVLVHDNGVTNAGLIMTANFNVTHPDWFPINPGLTVTQYQDIDKVAVDPISGEIYVACMLHNSHGFLAYAPYAGAEFSLVEDYASMCAKYGGSTDGVGIAAFGFNRLVPGQLLYCLTQAGENIRTYLGSGTTFVAKATFTNNTNNNADVSYGLGAWLFTASSFTVLSSDASSVVTSGSLAAIYGIGSSRHGRLVTSGETIHWRHESETAIFKGHNNCASFTTGLAGGLEAAYSYNDKVSFDITGTYLMARNGSFAPIRSFDGGATWVSNPNLPTTVNWYYACIDAARWIAVSSYIYYSNDFGNSAWSDKRGNILQISSLFNANVVKVLP